MHPTGIEPALKASEAYVLSVRLRVHVIIAYPNMIPYRPINVHLCPMLWVRLHIYFTKMLIKS